MSERSSAGFGSSTGPRSMNLSSPFLKSPSARSGAFSAPEKILSVICPLCFLNCSSMLFFLATDAFAALAFKPSLPTIPAAARNGRAAGRAVAAFALTTGIEVFTAAARRPTPTSASFARPAPTFASRRATFAFSSAFDSFASYASFFASDLASFASASDLASFTSRSAFSFAAASCASSTRTSGAASDRGSRGSAGSATGTPRTVAAAHSRSAHVAP